MFQWVRAALAATGSYNYTAIILHLYSQLLTWSYGCRKGASPCNTWPAENCKGCGCWIHTLCRSRQAAVLDAWRSVPCRTSRTRPSAAPSPGPRGPTDSPPRNLPAQKTRVIVRIERRSDIRANDMLLNDKCRFRLLAFCRLRDMNWWLKKLRFREGLIHILIHKQRD